MSELLILQKLHVELFVKFMVWAQSQGYSFTWGETKRSDEQAELNAIGFAGREQVATLVQGSYPTLAGNIRNNGKADGVRHSCHLFQLAVDLNAFKSDKYLSTTEEWQELGEYWEKLHPQCRWGGRFKDGNHLSLEYQGVK